MTPYAYEYGYGDDYRAGPPAGARYRMGLHDFSEHYGRYSGGPSYAYEFSERTVVHPSRTPGSHGFTRKLGPPERGLRGRPRGRPVGRPRSLPSGRARRRRRYTRDYDRFFRRRFGAWYRR